jgi:hypothetical protein
MQVTQVSRLGKKTKQHHDPIMRICYFIVAENSSESCHFETIKYGYDMLCHT